MRGLRSVAYGLLAVLLGVAFANAGFSPAAIGVLITVSLVGDLVGTYVIGLVADTWGRLRTLALLGLLRVGPGVFFGLMRSYLVRLHLPQASGINRRLILSAVLFSTACEGAS